MKQWISHFSALALMLLCTTSTLIIGAQSGYAQGSRVGRGGDSIAIEFQVSAQRVERLLRYYPGFVDADKIIAAIKSTTVVTLPRVLVDGVEKDAINFTNPNEIDLSADRWNERYSLSAGTDYAAQMRRRLTLAFHEYASIAGYDDSNGRYSLAFSELLDMDARGANIQNKMFCEFDTDGVGYETYLGNRFCF